MTQLEVRQRVIVGESGLPLILGVNALSLALLWLSGAILIAAGGQTLYLEVTVITIGAPRICSSLRLSSRASTSLAPPGVNATTMVTGRVG